MESKNTPTTLAEIISANREKILMLEEFNKIRNIADESEAKCIYSAIGYLIENNAYPIGELLQAYKISVEINDYTQFALMVQDYHIKQAEQKFQANPDDPKGRSRIESRKEEKDIIIGIKQKKGFNVNAAIGNPSFEDTPDWVLAIQQSGESYEKIWEMLENGEL